MVAAFSVSLPGGHRMTEMNLERFLPHGLWDKEAPHLNYDFLLLRPAAIEDSLTFSERINDQEGSRRLSVPLDGA